ncbi:hypothetical protein AB0H73_25925 [Streptomyces olivoreticuli]
MSSKNVHTKRRAEPLPSLPHSPGVGGIVVGKTIDQCKRCTSLNNMRRAAWLANDWDLDAWAREEFYQHWEAVHRNG